MQELDATTNVKNYYNPNSAFITFNTQDAYNWFRLNKTKLFGKKSKETIFKRAPEPTNIIWENRFVSKQIPKRAILVTLCEGSQRGVRSTPHQTFTFKNTTTTFIDLHMFRHVFYLLVVLCNVFKTHTLN